MKKEDALNSDIGYLIKILGKQMEKLDQAYNKKDAIKFNIVKKQVLELQRMISSMAKSQ